MTNEWPIHEIARLSGTTSRTLRHYGDVGLLPATRIGSNGYRYYDEAALVRLQRILMLRDLGLGLSAIAEVLDGQSDDTDALVAHLHWLRQEQHRLDRQIGAVEGTIEKLKGGERIMAEEALDGFDHTAYSEEVEHRWGREARVAGDSWWESKSAAEREEWMSSQKQLAHEWAAAAASGMSVDSEDARELARRQYEWLSAIPGTPGYPDGAVKQYFTGLGELYVDERFARNFGGATAAAFVRDAMAAWATREL
jgi:DNA-binding transcriptional MerR regulator